MILDTDEPCIMLGRILCREIGKKLKEDSTHKLTRWDKHLSEETRKQLQQDQEKQNQVLRLRQNSAGSEKDIFKPEIILNSSSESADNASGKTKIVEISETNKKEQSIKTDAIETQEKTVSDRNKKNNVARKTIRNTITLFPNESN